MIKFFKKPNEKVFNLPSLSRDELIYKVMPHFFMEILRKYFRLEVEGLEHLPKEGAALVCPNHSGYSGFDALVLHHVLSKDLQRQPTLMAHYFWFLSKTTAIPAKKLGFTEATYENGVKGLQDQQLVVLFPEGEHGNFKPSSEMYQLQEFKRGFVRMALETQSFIIPTLIIGAEETHINLNKLKFTRFLRGLVIPLPLNIVPLPAKWKIKFLPPIKLPYRPQAKEDPSLVHDLCAEIQEKMQRELNKEIKNRKGVYLP